MPRVSARHEVPNSIVKIAIWFLKNRASMDFDFILAVDLLAPANAAKIIKSSN
jgi:hypothetical protein